MTIALIGANGLFTRLGHLYGGLADALALRGGAATARVLSGANFAARMNTIEADYAAAVALNQVVDGSYSTLTAFQGGMGSIFTDFSARAQNTLKAMWSVDQGYSANSPLSVLTAVDTATALRTLIQQMTAAAASVQASTPAAGAQTALGTPNGNAVIVVSVKSPQGVALQYMLPEVLTFACTSDSQGGAVLGNEPLSVKGQPAVSDVWSQLWPGGSGASTTTNAVDGSKSNSAGNLLVNGDFVTYSTANVPDNWTLLVGAAGTDVFNGTAGGAYTAGGGALQFTGTGAALLDSVAQSFNTASSTAPGAGGTPATLKPDTQYAGSVWIKTSATPAAGAAEFSLVDGTNTVVNDDTGVAGANLAVRTLTNISTTWTNFNFVFRTPAVLPSTLKLRVRLSTAISSGNSVYFGRLGFAAMDEFYPGGPFVKAFSGNGKLIAGAFPDTWTLALTQTFGVFQSMLQRTFGLSALRLTIPSAASPTVGDALVA